MTSTPETHAGSSDIANAVLALRRGQLVGLPTETVYGLAADAENDDATALIFKVKGRPTNHPLIVHVASAQDLTGWVKHVPPFVATLADAFWPGPLTLIFERGERAHLAVTGGQETVAMRVPRHPVAQALLRAFGGGVAAPSANRFGSVSPTTAAHVRHDLGSDVSVILDGGECELGLESTIVDVSRGAPVLLRPGSITKEDLERVLGVDVSVKNQDSEVRAPGQLESHYAPRAIVRVVTADEARTLERADANEQTRRRVLDASGSKESIETVAHSLYQRLRDADREGVDEVWVVLPSDEGVGRAVRDRLLRAAGPRSK